MARPSLLAIAVAGGMTLLSPQVRADAPPPPPPAPSAAVGSGLEEVVVTARRREENLQNVPVSVTVLNQSTFDNNGAFSGMTLAQVVPGIHVTEELGDRNNVLYNIRGQSKTYGTEYPSVIPYFAEVPLNRLSTGQFFDIDNLQVLKGPQGTLFGRVTDGGAILLQPKRPSDDFDGYIQAKFGNLNLHEFEGAVNVPIVEDKVLLRAAFDTNQRDGYTHDITSNKDVDDVNYTSGRLSLLLRPTDGLENYSVVSYYQAADNSTSAKLAFVDPAVANPGLLPLFQAAIAQENALGPRSEASGIDPFSRRQNLIVSNITTYNINDDLTLKNVLGYVKIKEQTSTNYSSFSLPGVGPFSVYSFPQLNGPSFRSEQFSEEFQVAGKSFQEKLNWVAGLYTDFQHPGGYVAPEGYIFNEISYPQVNDDKDMSQAAYAQATYDLSDFVEGLSFTGGLRYTHERNSSTTQSTEYIGGVPFACSVGTGGAPLPGCVNSYDSTQHALTYTVGVDYHVNADTLLYVTSRRGFKGGGFNTTYSVYPEQGPYKAEYIQDVELGIKADWNIMGMPARTNLALYRADESNIQRLVIINVGGAPQSYVSNAADAVVQGLEFEGTLIPIDGLRLNAKWSYTNSGYDQSNAVAACNQASLVPAFCPDNPLQDTPLNQIDLDAHYTLPLDPSIGEVTFGGDFYFQTKTALGDNAYLSSIGTGDTYHGTEPHYHLINLDASWTSIYGRPVDLTFWARNLADHVYRVGANDLSYASAGIGTAAAIFGEPRTFGVTLKYRFGAGS